MRRVASRASQLARSGSVAPNLQQRLQDALTTSQHATADMLEATERTEWAINAHRTAHDELALALSTDASSVFEGAAVSNATINPSRMPTHPNDSSGGVAQQSNTLRDAMAECRKVLRQSENTFVAARSKSTSAQSAVQAAILKERRGNAGRKPELRPFE